MGFWNLLPGLDACVDSFALVVLGDCLVGGLMFMAIGFDLYCLRVCVCGFCWKLCSGVVGVVFVFFVVWFLDLCCLLC